MRQIQFICLELRLLYRVQITARLYSLWVNFSLGPSCCLLSLSHWSGPPFSFVSRFLVVTICPCVEELRRQTHRMCSGGGGWGEWRQTCTGQRSTSGFFYSFPPYVFRQGLSLNLKFDILVTLVVNKPPSFTAGASGLCLHTRCFTWVLGIQTQLAILAWLAFYPLTPPLYPAPRS